MTDVKIIDFDPKHFDCMAIRQKEKDTIFSLPDIASRYEKMASASVQAFTFVVDGRILFCAGFVVLWEGVADFWMVPSVYTKDYPFVFYRLVRRYLKVIPKTFRLHRMQTTSYDDAFHEKWMQKLGFEKEGVMKQYLHTKENMGVYGRIL